ncbi:MAG: helix-turn-helix domain-containing protein [bacterium]
MNISKVKLLSTAQAAEFLNMKPQTLRKWRSDGRGPKYQRFGGLKSKAYYRMSDIEAWLDEHSYSSTSDETVRGS